MAISFATLKAAYPLAPRPALYTSLGGEWPNLVNDPLYQNTCSIRLSIALKAAGASIPADLREGMDGAGSPLVIKVRTMERLATRLLGEFDWGMSKQPGVPVRAGDLPPHKGIIAYHVQWANATGHFDLWTGSAFVGNGNFDDVRDGYALQFWRVD